MDQLHGMIQCKNRFGSVRQHFGLGMCFTGNSGKLSFFDCRRLEVVHQMPTVYAMRSSYCQDIFLWFDGFWEHLMLKIAIAAKEIAVSLDETNAASLNSHSARTFFIFGASVFLFICRFTFYLFNCRINSKQDWQNTEKKANILNDHKNITKRYK